MALSNQLPQPGSAALPDRPRDGVRLLHTSDVHVDGYGVGRGDVAHADVCVCALRGLDTVARSHDVDGVLVVGDLFDHARIEEAGMRAVYELLAAMPGECVVMVGNHDVHDHSSLYDRHRHVVEGTGVHVFDDHDGSELRLFNDRLHLWGKAMDEHSPEFRPLGGVADRPRDAEWYLAMGHGHFVDDPGESHRSSLITPDCIVATEADYVALGHWHVTTDVSQGPVSAWYSGAPSGTPGGHALMVDLIPGGGVNVASVAVPLPDAGCAVVAPALS